MASPRAIRIPRVRPGAPAPDVPPPEEPGSPPPRRVERRRNQAGLERAHRVAAIYLGALAVLYVGFLLLDRSAPGGTSPAVAMGMLYFTAIAAALGVAGAVVALSPAPRAIEQGADELVVVEWWGHRRTFSPLGALQVSVVQRYPSVLLSSRPVEAVEIGTTAGGRRTYHLEAGLISERRPETRPLTP
ncbi:MAG: hypothetical protein ACRECT_01695 [Thermoplasmata archaeon]